MDEESKLISALKSFYSNITPYQITFLLFSLTLIFTILIIINFFSSPLPSTEAFATDPDWYIPTGVPTATATTIPTATATYTPSPPTITNTPSSSPTETPTQEPTTPPGAQLFFEGFESGDISAWTTNEVGPEAVAVVQTDTVWEGNYSIQLSETETEGSLAYIRKSLEQPEVVLRVSGYFYISEEGIEASNVPIFRLFNPTGERQLSFYRQNMSNDELWISFVGQRFRTDGELPLNTWAYIELHITAAGENISTISAYLDGIRIFQTETATLDEAGILFIQLGNDTDKQIFELYADNIRITK